MPPRDLRPILAALRDAPFSPASWTLALTGTAALCRASSAQLLTFGHRQAPVLLAPGFSDDDIAHFAALKGPDPSVNKGVAEILKAPLMRPISDPEYLTDAERARDPLYKEFFEPHGGSFAAFAVIARDGSFASAVNMFHHRTQGPLDTESRAAFNQLLPHFQRAYRLQRQLEDQAPAVAAGTLDAVNAAVLICDVNCRIVRITARAERLLQQASIVSAAHDRLQMVDHHADAAFVAAVRRATQSCPPPASSVLVATSRAGQPARIDVAPLPSGRGAATLRPLAMIHIQEPGRDVRIDVELAARAFGLTRAEAEVAAALANGLSSAEIAQRRGLTENTIHTQVKAILAKTGCARRAELPMALRPFFIE